MMHYVLLGRVIGDRVSKILISRTIFVLLSIASAGHAESPAAFEFDGGTPMVDCAFNRVLQNKCLLDTGSANSLLPHSLLLWSSEQPQLGSHYLVDASGQPILCTNVQVEILEISGINVNRDRVDVCLNSPEYGLIGINALNKAVWRIDFPNRSLQREPSLPGLLVVSPLKRDKQNFVYLPIKIGDRSFDALFDTGIAADGAISAQFLAENKVHFKYVGHADGAAFNTAMRFEEYRLDSMKFGDTTLKNKTFLLIDQRSLWDGFSGSEIILGGGTLRSFIWHLDLQNNTWATE
jgi:hypothetical protein